MCLIGVTCLLFQRRSGFWAQLQRATMTQIQETHPQQHYCHEPHHQHRDRSTVARLRLFGIYVSVTQARLTVPSEAQNLSLCGNVTFFSMSRNVKKLQSGDGQSGDRD